MKIYMVSLLHRATIKSATSDGIQSCCKVMVLTDWVKCQGEGPAIRNVL